MKRILYLLPIKAIIANEAGEEEIVDDLTPADIPWSEENEERAKAEAYNGEYTIEDDGTEVPDTPEARIAELEEALDMILKGVTE